MYVLLDIDKTCMVAKNDVTSHAAYTILLFLLPTATRIVSMHPRALQNSVVPSLPALVE